MKYLFDSFIRTRPGENFKKSYQYNNQENYRTSVPYNCKVLFVINRFKAKLKNL